MHTSDFGPFDEVASGGETLEPGGYLDLLHLQDPDLIVRKVLLRAAQAPGSENHLLGMLAQPNWRWHLPAAASIPMTPVPSDFVSPLWACFDGGSWVTPQLGATLFVVDPSFGESARNRLTAGCPVSTPKGLISVLRHIETGPAEAYHRSAKNAATLHRLLGMTPGQDQFLQSLVQSEGLSELLAADLDASGDIAAQWLDLLVKGLKELELWPI